MVAGDITGKGAADNAWDRLNSGMLVPRESAPRNSSLARQLSNARRQESQSTPALTGMPPPSGPLPTRVRRQSQYPAPAPSYTAARTPRKPVGSSSVTASVEDKGARQDAAATVPSGAQGSLSRSPSLSKPERHGTAAPSLSAGADVPRLSTTLRNIRTKSLQAPPNQAQAPPHQAQVHLTTQNITPAHGLPFSTGNARSPAKSPGQKNSEPPSSTGKRQSVVVTHMGGLGARTISPTDARRLKRLSTAPAASAFPQAPIPKAPPTPQSEASSSARPVSHSPAPVSRKSVTPSSARVTPDQIRRPIGSSLSISSTSSFSSLRPPSGGLSSRVTPTSLTSRLPTVKGPRNVYSSAGRNEDEIVPPVPAIPKAYESPKDQIDQPNWTLPRTPLPNADEGHGDASAFDTSSNPHHMRISGAASMEAATGDRGVARVNTRHRRGLTVGTATHPDAAPASHNHNRKNLQPIRLPPLNLLPLSTPTAAKIASFPTPSAEVDHRQTTPPPKRSYTKTPSTPMTASKATFFSRSFQDEDVPAPDLRSSSSQYDSRADPYVLYHSVSSPNAPVSDRNGVKRQTTTPFASASLPKGSTTFGQPSRQSSGEHISQIFNVDFVSPELVNSRPPLPPKQETVSAHASANEPATSSSGTPLRRKLSLGWKRSPSKDFHSRQASQHFEQGLSLPPSLAPIQPLQMPQRVEMPPPKLPASASSSTLVRTHTDSQIVARPSLDSSRRKSSATTMLSNGDYERPALPPPNNRHASMSQLPHLHTPQSVHAPMHRMLGSKSSFGTLKARNLDTNLDKDDLQAEKVMERLVSKRKDFEVAAKEVDELRKKAGPKERVAPPQALQMVSLNIFERGEIIDYKEVYFCGTRNSSKIVGDCNAGSVNSGYDDDRGDYNIVLGDHLAYRYEVVDVLGKGSFGQVVRCIDHKTGALVAVKIIRNKKRFHQQALIEVNILQKLREWVGQRRANDRA